MKKFRFKFDRLQKIREREEQSSLLRLSLAKTNLDREEKLLARLVGAVQTSGAELMNLIRSGASGEMIRNADRFRSSSQAAVENQRQKRQAAAGKYSDAQDAFRHTRQRAEVIRKLREKERDSHRRRELHEEEKEMDEVGNLTA
jgi:flagellar export protein FliJ